jgi:serine/threonine-protein kinase
MTAETDEPGEADDALAGVGGPAAPAASEPADTLQSSRPGALEDKSGNTLQLPAAAPTATATSSTPARATEAVLETAKTPSAAAGSMLVACRSCAGKNHQDAKFCSECGIRMQGSDALAETGAPISKRRDAFAVTIPGEVSVEEAGHIADPLIGVIIAGRYRIIEPLGRGGMGVVYRVEHARIGKLMALKLLTGELSRDNEVVARFKREALMVSKLSHPNTVQVFDFGTSEGMTYLAMEYLRGEDLGRTIRREGPLTASRTARIVTQVCSSLGEAHRLDIIHRDLKPENVFILKAESGAELVKVLDFGLAKLRESAELGEVTSRGAIVGTPFYMSPEQIRGEDADQRSDVYALGALTYVCLTGHPPFDAPRPMGVLTKHLVEKPENPSTRFPELNITPGVAAIVMKALEKEPDRRFQSVDALQHALIDELKEQGQSSVDILLDSGQMHALARADSEAVTRGEVELYERKLRRRGFLAWAMVLLTGGLILALGWHLILRAQAEPGFSGAEREPNNSAAEATPVPFGEKVRGQMGRRLDESRSDRDFYRIEVPSSAKRVQLSLSSLPNMGVCALVYRVGIDSPLGTYCSGAPARDLSIPVLELSPGAHYVAVMQDQDGYGAAPPLTQENVSDAYTLSVATADAKPELESEPNDSVKDANIVPPGGTFRGRFAWMRDVDVVCVSATPGATVQFELKESATGRPRQSVIQLTPHGGPADGVPVRVHAGSLTTSGTGDVSSPWRGPPSSASGERSACVEMTLVPNPLETPPHPKVAPASAEEYTLVVSTP